MVQINFALREVNCKIVFYGPGLSGKTTNLEIVHKKAPESNRGELTSIATEGDRTLFFDFMPLDLGTIAGMRTRFQLYTVPGQVYYNSTRKLVLQGVDGVVFVADSSESKMEENLESLENLKNNLAEYGKDIREIALVLQYNKRDLPDALPVEVLNEKLNPWGVPWFEAVAITGEGVFPTLKCLSGMVLETLNRDQREGPAAAARSAGAARAEHGSNVAVAAPPAIPSGGAPRRISSAESLASQSSTGDPPRPSIRPGSGMDQVAGAPALPQRMPPPQAAPAAGAPAQRSPGTSANRHRRVEATPLQPSIRATAAPAAGAQRRVALAQEKKFPWMMVGLAALVLVAVAAILLSLGIPGRTG